MSTDVDLSAPSASRPVPINLARSANYQCSKDRPPEPHDPNFELATNHIPEGFVQQGIIIDKARHLCLRNCLTNQVAGYCNICVLWCYFQNNQWPLLSAVEYSWVFTLGRGYKPSSTHHVIIACQIPDMTTNQHYLQTVRLSAGPSSPVIVCTRVCKL